MLKPHLNKTLYSTLYLLAPCVALGAFAFFYAHKSESVAKAVSHPQATAVPVPLKISFGGIERQQVTPMNLYQGYDHHFSLVFKASGDHPTWWGQPANGMSAKPMKPRQWAFWLERKGKRTPFRPERSQLWSSSWDGTKKRYINEVFLHTGAVPVDAVLKMKGLTRMALVSGAYKGAAIPVEVTLKRVGESWGEAPVSTNPTLAVQKVEIAPAGGGLRVGTLHFLTDPRFTATVALSRFELLDKQLRPMVKGMVPPNTVSRTPATESEVSTAANTLQVWWSSSAIEKASARDILLKCRLEQQGSWPLEVAFPIKKNGQLATGTAPIFSFDFALTNLPKMKAPSVQQMVPQKKR